MKNILKMMPNKLKVWLKNNGEIIRDVRAALNDTAIHISTDKYEYIYYLKRDELFVEIKNKYNEYERVLYPNRAVETSFEGM